MSRRSLELMSAETLRLARWSDPWREAELGRWEDDGGAP